MAITAASLMVEVGADTTRAVRALSSFSRSLGGTMNDGVRKAEKFSAQYNQAMSGIHDGVLKGLVGGISGGLSFGALTVGLSAAAGAIQEVTGDVAAAYTETERLTQSLRSLSARELMDLGVVQDYGRGLALTSERAAELLQWTNELALNSPLDNSDVELLVRLGMGYKFNSEQAKRSTAAVIDYGAAMTLTDKEMEQVIRSLGKMKQDGKVTTSTLSRLSDTGIDGLKILADAAGVSTTKMEEMIDTGLVPAGPAIEAIIQYMERYKGAAEEISSGTFGGLIETLGNLKELGEVELFGPAFKAAQPAVTELVNGLKSQEFRDGLNAIGTQIGVFAGEGVTAGAQAIKDAVAAFQAASTTGTPPWLAAITSMTGMQVEVTPTLPADYTLEVPTNAPTTPIIKPGLPPLKVPTQGEVVSVYLDPTQDYGVSVDTKAQVTTIDLQTESDKDGFKLTIDAKAKVSTLELDNPTGDDAWKINFVADWKQGTLGSLLAAAMDPFAGKHILIDAGWDPLGMPRLWNEAVTYFKDPITLYNSWSSEALPGLFSAAQTFFNDPIMVSGSWLSETLGGLWDAVQGWFSANPISIKAQTSYTPETTPPGTDSSGYSSDVTPPMPEYQYDPRYWTPPQGAKGFKNFRGGLALVGEKGPELVVLPAGADVIPNDKTMRMIPGFAEGTPGAASPFSGLSSSFGNAGDLAGMSAAKAIKDASKELTKSLKEVIGDLEDAIRSTPGVFGTSKVTADQMRMAELGVPQQFGDDYLRRLTDEVINGVNWAGVDIKEAAAAAGIDPNLPAQAILEMFRAAWADSSLFANPENLRFINTDAVKAQMERQQASEAGKSNIMALFGIGDDQLVAEIAGLGMEISTGLQTYLGEQGMGPVGAQAATGIGAGMAENGTPMGTGMVSGFMNWMTSPDGLTAIAGMGDGLVANLNQAFKKAAPGYDWTVPAGQGQPAPNAPTPPGFASGTSWFRGGWALVGEQGPELVRLPGGSGVLNAGETAAAMGGVNVVVNAAVSQPHDIELLARRVARMIQQKRGR